ncbi:MAG TPA: carboxypeptidase regulatory-like domain-containing protein [Bryobacteraceae bacterium]|nr:carboxypeptidase regulatory-like domain-containing protein [Bryobacteraceae bacterium]
MRILKSIQVCVAILTMFLLMGRPAVGQTTGDAEITGLIKDASASAIPNATVTLVNQDTGVLRTFKSDAEGRYRFAAVLPGRYSLKVEATGFSASTLADIVLNIGAHVDHDVPMNVGGVQESVVVTGEIPPIDVTKSDVSGVVNNTQIDTLPINTRQFINLALLEPGTSQDSSRTFYNSVQMGGAGHYYSNGFSVDGVTNTWAEMGEPRQNFPMGAIQEFKVNTIQYKADQGLSAGGVVNIVTKSGTNQFHGEAFEYARDQVFNRDDRFTKAADAQVGLTKAPFRRDQFGGDAGGPIVRNKLHFYGAFERTQTATAYTIYIPGAAAQFYPTFGGVHDRPIHDQMLNFRVDYQLNRNQHLFARYSQEWNFITWNGCGGSSMSNCYDGQIPRHSIVAGHTWTPTPTVVNEVRFQYAFSSYLLAPSGTQIFSQLGSYPAARLSELQTTLVFPSFNWGNDYADNGVEKRWEGKDDVSIMKGSHTLKLGVDVSRVPFEDDAPNGYAGSYTFAHDHYFNPNDPASLAALAASNDATVFTATRPPIDTKDPTTELGFYIQDDWKVRPSFTLSLGVRYDREFNALNEFFSPNVLSSRPYNPIVPIPGEGDPGKRSSSANFGPRFGFAWNVRGNSKDVIRGGYGIYYQNLQTLQNFGELRNYAQCSILITNPAFPDPFGGQDWQTFCSHAAPSPTILDPNYHNPYTQQFNLGYSRELTHDFSIHVDGAYTHTVGDYRTVDLNYPVNGVRPYPQFSRILDHTSIGQAKYKALYLRAEKRFARRYQFVVSYSLANNRDNNPEAQVTVPSNYNLDWGPASADRRHALIASTSVQLPWRFTLGAIWTVRSSLPFSAFIATTDADGVRAYVPGTSRDQGNRNLNLAAVNAYRATLGLAPITSANIDSSKYNGMDIKLSRTFSLKSERRRLELGLQVFDLFGTENLGVPSGQMTAGGNTTTANSPNFGRILGVLNNSYQQAELSARFVF